MINYYSANIQLGLKYVYSCVTPVISLFPFPPYGDLFTRKIIFAEPPLLPPPTPPSLPRAVGLLSLDDAEARAMTGDDVADC